MISYTSMVLDVTERERTAQALQASEQRLRWGMEQEQTLTRVVGRILSRLQMEEICEVAVWELRSLLQCDRVVVYRFHEDWSGEFVAEAQGEKIPPLLDQQWANSNLQGMVSDCSLQDWQSHPMAPWEGENPPPWMVDTYLQETQGGYFNQGQIYRAVNDIYTMGFSPCYVQFLEQMQARAYVIAGIYGQDRLWGLLAAYQNDVPRWWQNREIAVVTQIADQCSVALRQVELFQKLQQQAQELQVAKESAEAANRAKSEFLASMSHELRTPLNVILGFAQVLNRDPEVTPKQQENLSSILQSGNHLLGLINSVLDLSKIEADRMILQVENFDLWELLISLKRMLEYQAQAKGLTFKATFSPEVPRQVQGDQQKLRQILINLLGNSIKFTPSGWVRMGVSYQGEGSDRGQLILEVEDTGIGIKAEDQERIFEAFEQGSNSHKFAEGSGLGLTLTQRFVQLMEGTLTVHTPPHPGSLFRVTLPLTLAQAPETSTSWQSVVQSLDPAYPAPCILIAEDQDNNRELVVQLLELVGFQVLEARNGEEAIAQWQHPPQGYGVDLILMDMQMPVLSGDLAVQRIRELGGQVPIVALTASALTDGPAAWSPLGEGNPVAGCNGWMTKPFRAEDLYRTIAQLLPITYRYHSNPDPWSLEESEGSASLPAMAARISGQDLDLVPQEWKAELATHAACLDEQACLELVEQLPPDQGDLRRYLLELLHDFRFDIVLELLQATPSP